MSSGEYHQGSSPTPCHAEGLGAPLHRHIDMTQWPLVWLTFISSPVPSEVELMPSGPSPHHKSHCWTDPCGQRPPGKQTQSYQTGHSKGTDITSKEPRAKPLFQLILYYADSKSQTQSHGALRGELNLSRRSGSVTVPVWLHQNIWQKKEAMRSMQKCGGTDK